MSAHAFKGIRARARASVRRVECSEWPSSSAGENCWSAVASWSWRVAACPGRGDEPELSPPIVALYVLGIAVASQVSVRDRRRGFTVPTQACFVADAVSAVPVSARCRCWWRLRWRWGWRPGILRRKVPISRILNGARQLLVRGGPRSRPLLDAHDRNPEWPLGHSAGWRCMALVRMRLHRQTRVRERLLHDITLRELPRGGSGRCTPSIWRCRRSGSRSRFATSPVQSSNGRCC